MPEMMNLFDFNFETVKEKKEDFAPKKSRLPPKVQEDRKRLAEQVVKDIREGKPFFWDSGHYGKPHHNLMDDLQGKDTRYHGINNMILSVASHCYGFKDTRWATFKQVQSLQKKGVPFEKQPHIKRGAKGIPVEFWKYAVPVMEVNPKTGQKEPVTELDPETGKIKIKTRKLHPPLVRRYTVFNAEQMENIPPPHEITISDKDKNEAMEAMLSNSEAPILYDQRNQNFYLPSKDEIHLMPKEEFKSMADFYGTASHEIAHSTGAEKRLNREGVAKANSSMVLNIQEYAKEELRAEMASLFIAQEYGIEPGETHYKNHIAYLQSWADAIEKDPDELFRAASDADKAVTYIKTHMIEKNRVKEQKQELSDDQTKAAVPEKTAEDKLIDNLSLTIEWAEGLCQDAGNGQQKIVLGGGDRSFPAETPGALLTNDFTVEDYTKELGGHIYQTGKAYKGQELNQLVNDMIKDDITSSEPSSGYSKVKVIIRIGKKELSDRIDIGDGVNFDITGGKNGYCALVDLAKKYQSPLTKALDEIDEQKLAQKTKAFSLPSFTQNTPMYHRFQEINQSLADNFVDQAQNNPASALTPGEAYKKVKENKLSNDEIIKSMGYESIKDKKFEYTPKMMAYYVKTLHSEGNSIAHGKYAEKVLRADAFCRINKDAFPKETIDSIQEAAEALRNMPANTASGRIVNRYVKIENNRNQLLANTKQDAPRQYTKERIPNQQAKKVETKRHNIRRTIEIPDKKSRHRRYLKKKSQDKTQSMSR